MTIRIDIDKKGEARVLNSGHGKDEARAHATSPSASAGSMATQGQAFGLDKLAAAGLTRRFRSNTILINQGDPGGDLYIILEGSVRAFVEGPNERTLTVGDYQAGDYVGEMSLDGGSRCASVMTTSPTVCSVVSQDRLAEYIRHDPEFAMDLIKRLIERARNATESARTLALMDVYGRVRNLLVSQSESLPDGGRAVMSRLTQREIADQVGASREMISKVLKDLAVGGYIRVDQRIIHILRTLPDRW